MFISDTLSIVAEPSTNAVTINGFAVFIVCFPNKVPPTEGAVVYEILAGTKCVLAPNGNKTSDTVAAPNQRFMFPLI